nr:hypothetical protein [Tanacetum cinerariifolium]
MAVRTQPVLLPSISTRVAEVMALSPSSFHKRYRSCYETLSPLVSPASSLTRPIRKRYRGTSKPILDADIEDDESEAEGAGLESEESKDEGPGLEGHKDASEEQQKQAVQVKDTAMDEPLGLGYGAARRHTLELAKDPVPSAFEIGQSSRDIQALRMQHAADQREMQGLREQVATLERRIDLFESVNSLIDDLWRITTGEEGEHKRTLLESRKDPMQDDEI